MSGPRPPKSTAGVPWLGAALAAQTLSLGGSAAAQRRLLAAVGTRLPRRAMFGLALASAGLSSLIPAGQLPATAWLTGQYRRRGALGAWGCGPWWPTGSPPPLPSWRCCWLVPPLPVWAAPCFSPQPRSS